MRRLSRPSWILLLIVVALIGDWLFAQSPNRPAASGDEGGLRADKCMVKTIRSIRLPAGAEGRITELLGTEGANVQTGDLLARIDDTQAQLLLSLRLAEEREAEMNALNDVNIRDAQNTERSATAEAEAYKELRREGAVPYWEMEKKILEADRATLRIELVTLQQDIAKIQYVAKRSERQLAEHELSRRQVVAPFSGYIENRIAQLGEWVQPGSPIFELVQLDKLRVEGDVDALRYPGLITRGTPAKVLIYANQRKSTTPSDGLVAIDAKVGFVSSEIDLNHRCRIWVEIDNQQVGEDWMFKPGMEADILLFPNGSTN